MSYIVIWGLIMAVGALVLWIAAADADNRIATEDELRERAARRRSTIDWLETTFLVAIVVLVLVSVILEVIGA